MMLGISHRGALVSCSSGVGATFHDCGEAVYPSLGLAVTLYGGLVTHLAQINHS